MLAFGGIFAFRGQQLGRILSLAFAWATTALFGRVPANKQLYLSGMAGAALAWPIVLIGVLVPGIATFLLAFVTLPDWSVPLVRPAMIALAILLPLAVGFLSTRLNDPAPTGTKLVVEVVRGIPYAAGLFIVLLWMIVLAPLARLKALIRRRESAHVAIAVQPGGYETVVRDLAAALDRAGLPVTSHHASWLYEVPGRVLAFFGGSRVAALVPDRLLLLRGVGLEVTVHPMDLALTGKKGPLARGRAAIAQELTFTKANQTWTKEAQEIEDALAAAARGEGELDPIARRIAAIELDSEQWEILYRLLMQVRLRTSLVESDALEPAQEPVPAIAQRLAGIAAAVRALWPPRRTARPLVRR
ncbi:MAG: hypothetical protein NVS1B1_11880 [Candidatus Limnocylindrales bacterium]